jgi:aminoglycoside 3-N-acetyltransferase
MLDYPALKSAFEKLALSDKPVIAHASLRPFGQVNGGAGAVLEAMLDSCAGVIMPTHTYKTQIVPEVGPPNNGITYGSGRRLNQMAEPFRPDMRADPLMGILPETLRRHPSAGRTSHPILSFAGVNADFALSAQTLQEPLAPVGALAEKDGWVVLINVDHTVNTSMHYAERLAGRTQFVRWALTGDRVLECPNYPGDSRGFQAIEPYLLPDTRCVKLGQGYMQALPLQRLLDLVQEIVLKDPLALLCDRSDCERCNAVKATGR